MSSETPPGSNGAIDYIAIEESPRFLTLKRTQRSFIFPLAAFFLIWYFAYVLLAAFATDFMAQRVWGDITIGLLLGLGQFVTTFAITMAYVSFANRKLDPLSTEIREDLEKAQGHA
ncbi:MULTISPECIES: DUF485 domain-containing protein [unclassified Microbacterium]|uniref:DUF485 domain-containing protein n=1 Tax=unclassified Microbacterium TaxID=2609290 RepID=UPI000EA9E1EE|nr:MULTISPECIES: DUF485 domain-containing protein [unclassified Microbacterium]MBT2483140.1 DUF485 domain-containing protein [Microbacterium sp. ISL-108]RKN66198.1 DUF485 domain-containing protein [Microbacterium sp. CGR2]